MKKYIVDKGDSDSFECEDYNIHETCIEFIACGEENEIRIVPIRNYTIHILPIKNN